MHSLKNNKILKPDFLKLEEESIMFITNPGRMGDEDGITFVVKNDKKLLKCFDKTSNKIINKNAFVEIRQEDYSKIEKFLSEYDDLRKNDFDIKSEENKK